MPARICSKPGCPAIHDGATGSRCPPHTKAAKQDHWAKTRAYSSKAHREVFRAQVLARDHLCVLCGKIATVADHYPKSRQDLEQLGMNPDDPAHGRGLCKGCHDTETARNQPGGWNARG